MFSALSEVVDLNLELLTSHKRPESPVLKVVVRELVFRGFGVFEFLRNSKRVTLRAPIVAVPSGLQERPRRARN